MAYDPHAITADERSFALKAMWFGFASALIMLAVYVLDLPGNLEILFGGFTAGSLIGMMFVGRQDEYYNRLAASGSRWATSFAGLWLFFSIVPGSRDLVTDHLLGLYLIAVTFHIGFAVARFRGY